MHTRNFNIKKQSAVGTVDCWGASSLLANGYGTGRAAARTRQTHTSSRRGRGWGWGTAGRSALAANRDEIADVFVQDQTGFASSLGSDFVRNFGLNVGLFVAHGVLQLVEITKIYLNIIAHFSHIVNVKSDQVVTFYTFLALLYSILQQNGHAVFTQFERTVFNREGFGSAFYCAH